jgi:hypothetical protein
MINSDLPLNPKSSENELSVIPNPMVQSDYSKLTKEYNKSCFHQSVEKIARIITLSPKLYENFRFQPTFLLLKSTIHSLLMNPIETTVLAHLLDQILQVPTNYTAEVFLMYSGYAVKQFFSSDLPEISAFLEAKFVNFHHNFEEWAKKTGVSLNLTIDQVLSMYKNFSRFSGLPTNYNAYVDEILQSSPPYQVNKRNEGAKKKKKGKPRKCESEESSEEFLVFNDFGRDLAERQAYSKICQVLNKEITGEIDVQELVKGVCKSRKKNRILVEVSMMF